MIFWNRASLSWFCFDSSTYLNLPQPTSTSQLLIRSSPDLKLQKLNCKIVFFFTRLIALTDTCQVATIILPASAYLIRCLTSIYTLAHFFCFFQLLLSQIAFPPEYLPSLSHPLVSCRANVCKTNNSRGFAAWPPARRWRWLLASWTGGAESGPPDTRDEAEWTVCFCTRW